VTDVSFGGITPLIPASDVQAAIAFYTEKLGFTEMWRAGEPVTEAGVLRDAASVIFFECKDRAIAEMTSFRIRVLGIEAFYEQCTAAGVVHPNGALTVKPWGTNEFAILDPSGVCITFWQP
jgi:catechol 2,3-dioxygenase-like lactoylglutathione lyase family enzyme